MHRLFESEISDHHIATSKQLVSFCYTNDDSVHSPDTKFTHLPDANIVSIITVCTCMHEITAVHVMYNVCMSNYFNGKSPVTEHMTSTI